MRVLRLAVLFVLAMLAPAHAVTSTGISLYGPDGLLSEINFGTVRVGETAIINVDIYWDFPTDLGGLTDFSFDPQYGTPFVAEAGCHEEYHAGWQCRDSYIQFSPSEAGTFTAQLKMFGDGLGYDCSYMFMTYDEQDNLVCWDSEEPRLVTVTYGSGFLDIPVTGTAIAPVPIPAAMPLLASGVAGLGLVGWYRRRKATKP